MNYVEAVSKIKGELAAIMASEPFAAASLTLNIIHQSRTQTGGTSSNPSYTTKTERESHEIQDFCANRPVSRLNAYIAALDAVLAAVTDYGDKLFNDPTQEYPTERQHWYELAGYATAYERAGIFNMETLKTDKDTRFSQTRGLLYGCLEKMTDEEWIFFNSAWESLKAALKEIVVDYGSYTPPDTYYGQFSGTAAFTAGNDQNSFGGGESFSFFGTFPEEFPTGSHTFSSSSWDSNPSDMPSTGTGANSRTYKQLLFSNWKQSNYWGDDSNYGPLKSVLDSLISVLSRMASDSGAMAAMIYEWKAIGQDATNIQSVPSPLMNDETQLGANEGYAMTGVYKLSGDKFRLFDSTVGTAVTAWKESKEIQPKKTNEAPTTLEETRQAIANGTYNPYDTSSSSQNINILRNEYILSRMLQSIGFFGRAKSVYDRVTTLSKKWKWIY
jgi:hypothetical protein